METRSRLARVALASLGLACVSMAAPAARADVDPLTGIDFVRIGAVNNPAYDGPDPFNRVLGRGSVGYEYNIGRTEVPSSLWQEFIAAAFDRPDPLPWVQRPLQVGSGNRPTGGVSWRTAAIFTNWLCNNKSTDRAAFLNGAYDVSTFRTIGAPDGTPIFLDQWTHNPGARYWIPTLDEWIKAAHFDPNRNGTGQPGWWQYDITSDVAPIYGPPVGFPNGSPTNQANSGFGLPGGLEFTIPLGAYANVTSPWGLYDTAGATSEWTEEVVYFQGLGAYARDTRGSGWASGFGGDLIYGGQHGGTPDQVPYTHGLRLAFEVPSPIPVALFGLCGIFSLSRRQRKEPRESLRRGFVC